MIAQHSHRSPASQGERGQADASPTTYPHPQSTTIEGPSLFDLMAVPRISDMTARSGVFPFGGSPLRSFLLQYQALTSSAAVQDAPSRADGRRGARGRFPAALGTVSGRSRGALGSVWGRLAAGLGTASRDGHREGQRGSNRLSIRRRPVGMTTLSPALPSTYGPHASAAHRASAVPAPKACRDRPRTGPGGPTSRRDGRPPRCGPRAGPGRVAGPDDHE